MSKLKTNRWIIASMATCTHLLLGTVYAWSFFQKPITESFGWTQSETAWAFSISIFMLGITAAWCGGRIHQIGVKKLAVLGGFLYALGYIISFFALHFHLLPLLYLGFGVIGGIGLGLAYVTPVAAVSEWFPEKSGFITGMVVMGFGLGAFLMSKVLAPFLLSLFNGNLAYTFLGVGCILLILLPISASFLKASPEVVNAATKKNENISSILKSKNYQFIWLIFLFNIVAGMIFIAFQSPLLQNLLMKNGISDALTLSEKGATLIAVSAVFNGIGRFFWGSLSDKIGKITAFRWMLILEILCFVVLIFTQNPTIFFAVVCLILLCYGGGFGMIPSLIKERFGVKLMASLYGIVLVAWGFGGIIGPQVTAYLSDHFPENAGVFSYYIGLGLLLLGLILSLSIKIKKAA